MVQPISSTTTRGAADPHLATNLPADKDGEQHVAWLAARSGLRQEKPYHYLLVLRFALVRAFNHDACQWFGAGVTHENATVCSKFCLDFI